jgi:hypothetical protein
MARHSHKFTIADDDAVRALVDKLVDGGKHQQRREKLLLALDDASRHYKDSNQKVRQVLSWTADRLCSCAQTLVAMTELFIFGHEIHFRAARPA